MSFNALAFSVLIASPGDVAEARDAVEDVIRYWNADRAQQSRVVLLPLRWEINAISDLSQDAQSAINEQLVDHADIIIGVFDSRLGSRTPRALSGSVEELDRGINRGARVHVYFSDGPLPRDVDIDQLVALKNFRKEIHHRGLLGSYRTSDELRSQVRSALEKDISILTQQAHNFQEPPKPARPSVVFEVTCESDVDISGAQATAEESRENLEIEVRNVGDSPAENLTFRLTPVGDGELPINRLDDLEVSVLAPMEARRFPVYRTLGTAQSWQLHLRWTESGTIFGSSHVVAVSS